MLALGLVGLVLMQRSEGGALGIGGGGGGGGGMSGFMTGRSTANLLSRTTAIMAAAFMATSLILAIMAGGTGKSRSILDAPLGSAGTTGGDIGGAPAGTIVPVEPAPADAAPILPATPLVPPSQ